MYTLLSNNKVDFEECWKKTKIYGAAFENYLKNYQTKVLELIPKYSGYNWSEFAEPIIYVYPIYPFRGFPSFSHPLTLKVREDPILTLGIFIHELTHNNMYLNFPSVEILERLINTITVRILEDLFLTTDSYRSHAIEIFEKRFGSKFLLEPELVNKTAKEYLKRFDF